MIAFSKFLEQQGFLTFEEQIQSTGFITLDQIQGMGAVIPPSRGNSGSADFLQNDVDNFSSKAKKKKKKRKTQIQFFSQEDTGDNDND